MLKHVEKKSKGLPSAKIKNSVWRAELVSVLSYPATQMKHVEAASKEVGTEACLLHAPLQQRRAAAFWKLSAAGLRVITRRRAHECREHKR